MNTIKRRWPDLLIGVLVLLLLGGFAALLLGKSGPGASQTGSVQSAGRTPESQSSKPQSSKPQSPVPPPVTPTPTPENSGANSPSSSTVTPGSTPSSAAGNIPTIPAAPVTEQPAPTTPAGTPQATQPQPTTQPPTTTRPSSSEVVPRVGGAVAVSETRTPTRSDYRISLGSYPDQAAVQSATAGVGRLGYTVYPIAVASGVVAQVGPFASREAAAQALDDIRRALPGALLYPPRNAPAGSSPAASTSAPSTGTVPSGAELAATGPVYLQVGAYNTAAAAQTAVGRVRGLGFDPSVNAPAGKLVTVVVGPFQGQALVTAEARLQAGGIDSFRVR
ncbi:SPOR domain-containing protein [Deinococcus sp.]|uniref:SPOR domain-containing protein n=1 Tax=Deinococcus sp. TaxID=47478 RepID=UPI003C7E3E90